MLRACYWEKLLHNNSQPCTILPGSCSSCLHTTFDGSPKLDSIPIMPEPESVSMLEEEPFMMDRSSGRRQDEEHTGGSEAGAGPMALVDVEEMGDCIGLTPKSSSASWLLLRLLASLTPPSLQNTDTANS